MKKTAILAAVMSFAVLGTAFAAPPPGGPGHHPGPGRPGPGMHAPRRHMPPPPGYHHRRVQRHGSDTLFDISKAIVYKHVDMAYNDAYAAAYVLARGFHKDYQANQLVASANSLNNIRDDYATQRFMNSMRSCMPAQSEIEYMVREHREYLKDVMLDAKAYQHSSNKHFGWLGFGTIAMFLTCPQDRKAELQEAVAYAIARSVETKAIFKNFADTFKTIKGLVTPAEMKEAAKRGSELKKMQEQSYGF